MNYKIRQKIGKDETTTDVGNGAYNIGSGLTDRFNNIFCATFQGDTTGAYYGDLAERYSVNPDISLPIGTVMEISDSEFDAEICDKDASEFVVGIISKAPGFEMNTKMEDGAVVGLVGRVPVRTIGPVYKKDILISAGNGCLRSATNVLEHIFKVAIALETNDNPDEKLVLGFVK